MSDSIRQTQPHLRDEHCDVDPRTDLCRVCRVIHGDPCSSCGQRAYHLFRCSILRPAARGEVKRGL